MKKQINPTIKAHLIRGAFYLLLIVAVCAIPFALAQRNATKRPVTKVAPTATVTPTGTPSATPTCTPGGSQGPWMIVADYPTRDIESAAVTSNGTFGYSAGGLVTGNTSNGLYRYDPAANTWRPLANVTIGFYAAAIAYAANTNKIYVFGGVEVFTVLATTQIYDIATNTWSMGAPMPDPNVRFFPAAAY